MSKRLLVDSDSPCVLVTVQSEGWRQSPTKLPRVSVATIVPIDDAVVILRAGLAEAERVQAAWERQEGRD